MRNAILHLLPPTLTLLILSHRVNAELTLHIESTLCAYLRRLRIDATGFIEDVMTNEHHAIKCSKIKKTFLILSIGYISNTYVINLNKIHVYVKLRKDLNN